MKRSTPFKKWIGMSLDLPQDVVLNLPRITMIGASQLYVENHDGILRFTSQQLRLHLLSGELLVTGEQLTIRKITSDELFLEGNILHSIHYLQS